MRVPLTRLLLAVLAVVGPLAPVQPALAGASPVGWLDAVDLDDGTVTVVGWAADPDTDRSAGVHVYVDGAFAFGGPADLTRPDVDRATALATNRGFRFVEDVGSGRHEVCVYALDKGGDANRRLGCCTVGASPTPLAEGASAAGGSPKGWIDSASPRAGGVGFVGWAMDPDVPDPIGVHLYRDGVFLAGFRADRSRPDVGRAFGNGATHGFGRWVASPPGTATFCLYGIDRTGDRNALIWCRRLVVPFAPGAGAVVTASGVVMPVLGSSEDSFRVMTACANTETVPASDVTHVDRAHVVIDAGHGGSERAEPWPTASSRRA